MSAVATRRALLLAAGASGLAGCVGMPVVGGVPGATDTEARKLLSACAEAHGWDAWKSIRDISVSYEGEWYSLVKKLQPELVDDRYRQRSQERIIPALPLTAQQHAGPAGGKFVLRGAASVEVRYDDKPATDGALISASALVADAYRMFLTAPFMFMDAPGSAAMSEPQWLGGRRHAVLLLRRNPGLGWPGEDRVALFIDEETKQLHKLRFTIDALDSTKGAVVEVELSAHRRMHGVLWPTQFFERIRTPVPMLPAHRWWMTGLDINRGLQAGDFARGRFSARAATPAQPLPAS